jgi:hypothetical protein
VLSGKTRSDDNFQNTGVDFEQSPINIEGFSDEFRNLLQMNQRAGEAPSVNFGVNSSNCSAFQRAGFKKNYNDARRLFNGLFHHTAFKSQTKAIPRHHSVFEIVENGCGAPTNETRDGELAL